MAARWWEVGDRVLVRRHDTLDLTTGLVIGDERCLVIDTGGDESWGNGLHEAVRRVTSLPPVVVLTHGHFDHCFGTAAFAPCPVWAHTGSSAWLTRTAGAQRSEWTAWFRAQQDDERAAALSRTEPVLPNAHVPGRSVLDLGGRSAALIHPGRGHTDHDLVVAVADADVVFAGDLVEQGAPPAFEDAFPDSWPHAAEAVAATGCTRIVPGHGDPVGPDFVRAQATELAQLARLHRGVHTGQLTEAQAVRDSPYTEDVTRTALARPLTA